MSNTIGIELSPSGDKPVTKVIGTAKVVEKLVAKAKAVKKEQKTSSPSSKPKAKPDTEGIEILDTPKKVSKICLACDGCHWHFWVLPEPAGNVWLVCPKCGYEHAAVVTEDHDILFQYDDGYKEAEAKFAPIGANPKASKKPAAKPVKKEKKTSSPSSRPKVKSSQINVGSKCPACQEGKLEGYYGEDGFVLTCKACGLILDIEE